MLAAEGTLELRATEKGKSLSGYAARFNTDSHPIMGLFIESIAPGAFKRSLDEQDYDVRAYFNHNPSMLLGRQGNGTLRLAEDDKGLRFDLDLPDTQLGRDMAALVQRGDLYGMSFGFHTRTDEWKQPEKRDDYPHRTLKDVSVFDVSLATEPAYEAASVALRTAERYRDSWKEELELLNRRLMLAERL